MSGLGGKEVFHKRLSDFEPYDKIVLDIVPRYKQSGLSGDEWRQSVSVTFLFKGNIVQTGHFGTMKSAIMMLGAMWIETSSPIPDTVLKAEEILCDQPSCVNHATARYILKELFSRNGEKLDPSDSHGVYFRKFCDAHKTRGDCGREDADTNYDKQPMV
jgi:hypothetical protein